MSRIRLSKRELDNLIPVGPKPKSESEGNNPFLHPDSKLKPAPKAKKKTSKKAKKK